MIVTPSQITYRIRPIAPGDRDELIRFYATLSTDSLEARFHGATPGIADGTAGYFCGCDHEHREGLVAESTGADGRPVIVGHICLEPTAPGEVEVAIAVADRWQHHGLGHLMLSRAIGWARSHGVASLTVSVRWSNGAMVGLIRSMGLPVTVDHSDAGVVDAIVDIRGALPHAA